MKKTILLFAIIFVAILGKAQTNIGLRIGSSYSDVKLSEDLYERWLVEPKAGIVAGVFADIPLFKSAFSLQPEVNYVQKNTFWTSRDNYPFVYFYNDGTGKPYFELAPNGDKIYFYNDKQGGTYDNKKHLGVRATQDLKMNYVDIPILLKYKFRGRSSQFYINVGPRFGLGISATAARGFTYQDQWLNQDKAPLDGKPIDKELRDLILTEIGFNPTTDSNPLEFGSSSSSEFKKVDVGFVAGLGYTFEVEDVGFFSIDARYNTASKNIFNGAKVIDKFNDLIRPDQLSSAKFKGWMLSLSYAYPLGGF